MKVRRFKIEFPLPGDGRKGKNRSNSRFRGRNNAESGHPARLSEYLDSHRFDRFKSIDFGIDEINAVEDRACDKGRISRDSRLERIRRNIATGYYNSPEFIEKLADKLIKKLDLATDRE
jgi:hypothetical protein